MYREQYREYAYKRLTQLTQPSRNQPQEKKREWVNVKPFQKRDTPPWNACFALFASLESFVNITYAQGANYKLQLTHKTLEHLTWGDSHSLEEMVKSAWVSGSCVWRVDGSCWWIILNLPTHMFHNQTQLTTLEPPTLMGTAGYSVNTLVSTIRVGMIQTNGFSLKHELQITWMSRYFYWYYQLSW